MAITRAARKKRAQADGGQASMAMAPNLFLEVLETVPRLMDEMSSVEVEKITCVCWSALLAVMRHYQATTDVESQSSIIARGPAVAVRKVRLVGPLLAGLARRITPGSRYAGQLEYSGVLFPVEDARALHEAVTSAGVTEDDEQTELLRWKALRRTLDAASASGAKQLRVVRATIGEDDTAPCLESEVDPPEEHAPYICSLLRTQPVLAHMEELTIVTGRPCCCSGGTDADRAQTATQRILEAVKGARQLREVTVFGVGPRSGTAVALANLASGTGLQRMNILPEVADSPAAEHLVDQLGFSMIASASVTSGTMRSLAIINHHHGDAVAATCAMLGFGALEILLLPNTGMTDAGASSLATAAAKSNKLESLFLESNRLGPVGGRTLAALVRSCSALRHLSVARNKIGPAAAVDLCDAVAVHATALQNLDLFSCGIGDDGAAAAGRMLASHSSIQTLDVRANDIGDQGAEELARGLAQNRTLRRAFVADDTIHSRGVTALARAVADSTSLEELTLWVGAIHTPANTAGKALGDMLARSTSLKELALKIAGHASEWESVFAGLARNQSLVSLNLGLPYVPGRRAYDSYRVGEDGAAALARALASNHTLRELHLPRQYISPTGTTAIARALHTNTGLQRLSLAHNTVLSRGAMALAQALRVNRSLQHLDLLGNPRIGAEVVQALRDSVDAHPERGAFELWITEDAG